MKNWGNIHIAKAQHYEKVYIIYKLILYGSFTGKRCDATGFGEIKEKRADSIARHE